MKKRSVLSVILSMVIFGTIGPVRKEIILPSSVVAFFRAAGGALFLLIWMAFRRICPEKKAIRENAFLLCLSGTLLGFNWIALFESYRYTTVAVSTLCYYMAPVLIILVSPLILKERLTLRKFVCVLIAAIGMTLVTGVVSGSGGSLHDQEVKGILLGLAAAAMYAAIVLCNKKMNGIGGTDRTLVQLSISAAVLFPYILLKEDISLIASADMHSVVMMAVAAIVHTGIAYTLYFSAVPELTGQSAAILSYIDPIVAVVLSAFVLKEPMTRYGFIGSGMVLLAMIAGETGNTFIRKTDRQRGIRS